MNDDNEKKELEEQDPLDDNQEDNDSDDEESNDDESNEESNDESLKELLDAARELTDNIINSGMPDGDDEDKLIKISNKISSNIRKNAIIIGLILFPICSLLFLALSGIINWIEYDKLFVVIGLFVIMAFIDNLLCTLIKLFAYKVYLFSFGGIRQLILIIIFLLVYFLSNYFGLRIVGIWPMILVFELYALVKAIIGFIIDSFILKKK